MEFRERLEKINLLAKKKREIGLSQEEQEKLDELRQEYLSAFLGGFRNHIEGIKVVDPEGTDVTPDKLKQIQKEKGLHNRL